MVSNKQSVSVKPNILKDPEFIHVKTQEGIEEIYEKLKNEKIIAIDTEGTGLDPYTSTLTLFQIGSRNYSYVIESKYIKDWTLIKKLCEDENKLKILQNAKFDYKFVKVALNIEIKNIYDTMIAEALLRCGLPRNENLTGLAFLTKRYLGGELEKEVRKSFFNYHGSMNAEQVKYAALDIIVLFSIFDKQYPLLQKQDLVKVAKLEFKVVPVVGDMELRGFYIDAQEWRDHIHKVEIERKRIAKELQKEIRPYFEIKSLDLFGNQAEVINLNSQIQLMELFNDKLGLSVPSTGVAVLQTVDHPIAKLMLEYRGYEKLISAFGETLLNKVNPVTHRLHPDYMQMGTTTGRFACASPNLQQIPSRGEGALFRTFFKAPKGRKLITCDYSQQEMRVLADVSGDPTLLDAYKTGKDLHSLTAAQMYGLEYTDDFKEKHGDLRQAAKTINFGLVYGRGPSSLAVQLGVSVDEAKNLVKKYFEKMPQIGNWLDNAAKGGAEKGYAETLLGRKRYFTKADPADPNYTRELSSIERASKNMPIQGTSADMTKLAMIHIAEKYKKEGLDAGIIHTLHDEIVSEASDKDAERAYEIQHEEMVSAGSTFLKKCPIEAEGGISQQWEH
ncbi:hypothetical protein COV24_03240 [candidate division WWE3 bacterium CG10_big_fil_rev_8_21_14_0_10_32_10]|uniref:DNA polymerase I n=1 Tax=candidate division WWE3 bacterium CG10_big_fil_rev_8_21_14_0_10_32_10 TaxID=1975090 RepID=A0A2H0RA10_UNCKA|nr:MAG: hypothetical protein COV24_03240 [candidate division WWE3 bacterium CG10_big_fil_rev_8_21_14_0_10_32_10]